MLLVLFLSPNLVRFVARERISAQNSRGISKLDEGAVFKHSKFDGLVSQWTQLSFSATLRK